MTDSDDRDPADALTVVARGMRPGIRRALERGRTHSLSVAGLRRVVGVRDAGQCNEGHGDGPSVVAVHRRLWRLRGRSTRTRGPGWATLVRADTVGLSRRGTAVRHCPKQ